MTFPNTNPGIVQMAPTGSHIAWGAFTRTSTYVDQKAEVHLFNLYTGYCGGSYGDLGIWFCLDKNKK